MAKGKFVCGQCGKEFKRSMIRVDEDGFYKSCVDSSCGTSNLTEDDEIESLSREDFRKLRIYLGLSKVDQLFNKTNEELAKIPSFNREINGYTLKEFLKV